jgi:hypothetical protein
VQRLFTAFPSGAPGLGLVLLRLAVAIAMLGHSAACLDDVAAGRGVWLVGALAAVTALLLVLGLVTPVGGGAAAATAAGLALSILPSPSRSAFAIGSSAAAVTLAAAALAFLGPGAFSIDAALFGRREIAIPRPPRDEAERLPSS